MHAVGTATRTAAEVTCTVDLLGNLWNFTNCCHGYGGTGLTNNKEVVPVAKYCIQVLAEVKQTVLYAVTVQYAVSYQTSQQLRNNAVRHADVPASFRI